MKKPVFVWLFFVLFLCAVLAAVSWLTMVNLKLESAAKESRLHAAHEENVRLALWRLESYLKHIIDRENSRPYSDYDSEVAPGGKGKSQPALREDLPTYLYMHFQLSSAGRLTSPQYSSGGSGKGNAFNDGKKTLVLEAPMLTSLGRILQYEKLSESLARSLPAYENINPKN